MFISVDNLRARLYSPPKLTAACENSKELFIQAQQLTLDHSTAHELAANFAEKKSLMMASLAAAAMSSLFLPSL